MTPGDMLRTCPRQVIARETIEESIAYEARLLVKIG